MLIRHKNLIREFAADARELGAMFGLYVRDAKLANELHARELRSKKHDHLAVCYDELGHAFILRRNGSRVQLLKGEF